MNVSTKEKWAEIKGYEKLYSVSNLGRVKSNITNRILSACGKIYLGVVLCKDNKKTNRTVHSLVLEAFIKPESADLECNHKDGNKKNNSIENLEWCTRSDNIKHAYISGLNTKTRKVIRDDGEVYYSVHEAARKNKAPQMGIWRVLNNLRNKCRGHNFKYMEM